VNQLLDYVMRDFVSSWWSTLNVHKDTTFERLVRERLNVAFLNVQKILLNQERNDIVMSTLYGVANTLIIHMVSFKVTPFVIILNLNLHIRGNVGHWKILD
jgi:hypothetical protein